MSVDYEKGRKLLHKRKSDKRFWESSGFKFNDFEESTKELREFLFENVDTLLNEDRLRGAKMALDKTVEWLDGKGLIRAAGVHGEHLTGCVAFSIAHRCDCPLPHIRHALDHL